MLQVEALQKDVFKANAATVAEFEADKPRLKSLLQALNENRLGLKKEVARLQAIVAKGQGMAPSGKPGELPGISFLLPAKSRGKLFTPYLPGSHQEQNMELHTFIALDCLQLPGGVQS